MLDTGTQSSDTHNLHGNRNSNCYSDGLLQLRPSHHQESMDSGETSPPLWKSRSPSPQKSPSRPLLSHHNHRSLSPDSRAQAIARGQWELMEMVKNMPESSYELTLKDLVEHRSVEPQAPENELRRGAVKERRREIGRKYERNGVSLEKKGVFLNVVFPVSLESRKKNGRGKVSPKPEGLKGGGEREWWKKRFTGSSDSDSSRTSNGSSAGSSGGDRGGGRKRRDGVLTGCWPFSHAKGSKSV